MNKRRNKNRHPKPLAQTVKPRFSRAIIIFLASVVVVSLGFWWWASQSADISSAANPTAATSNSEFQKLKGRWRRPDGGYIMEFKSIAPNGSMDAAYFNPRSIHVARAEASRDGDATKVFIELRDVNYPGSTYSLTYDPASDQLKGIYYQAVERQRFEVVFERIK